MATTWKLTRNADGEPDVEEWGDSPRFGTSLMGAPEILGNSRGRPRLANRRHRALDSNPPPAS
jgi:hypothetical protein